MGIQDIFIDGAAELQVSGSLVRVNLVVNSPVEKDDNGERVRDVKYQMIMTPLAVTELHRGLTQALQHLSESGVVERRGGAEAEAAE